MIKHIVMWKLWEEANNVTRQENAKELKRQLEALPALVPGIISLEVGIGYKPVEGPVFDMVLTTAHATKADLKTYAEHPEHLEVAAFASKIAAERRVVDYEM